MQTLSIGHVHGEHLLITTVFGQCWISVQDSSQLQWHTSQLRPWPAGGLAQALPSLTTLALGSCAHVNTSAVFSLVAAPTLSAPRSLTLDVAMAHPCLERLLSETPSPDPRPVQLQHPGKVADVILLIMNLLRKVTIGTDVTKALRKHAASTEPSWQATGRGAGVEIWRTEDLQVKKWLKAKHGKFHKGDSYIVPNTTVGPVSGKLLHDIRCWLGRGTTADEIGTAAYKALELGNFLYGTATACPLKHCNCAGIGTDEDKALQEHAAWTKAAWHHCGQEAGVEV